ncbi:unnamed protein product, partial [Meganyctiphanes norvegica]
MSPKRGIGRKLFPGLARRYSISLPTASLGIHKDELKFPKQVNNTKVCEALSVTINHRPHQSQTAICVADTVTEKQLESQRTLRLQYLSLNLGRLAETIHTVTEDQTRCTPSSINLDEDKVHHQHPLPQERTDQLGKELSICQKMKLKLSGTHCYNKLSQSTSETNHQWSKDQFGLKNIGQRTISNAFIDNPPCQMKSLRTMSDDHKPYQYQKNSKPEISQRLGDWSNSVNWSKALLEPCPMNSVNMSDEFMRIMSDKLKQCQMKIITITMSDEFTEVEYRLFEMFGNRENKTININKFLLSLISSGMRHDDPRLQEMLEKLRKVSERDSLCGVFNVNYKTFMSIISENMDIIVKALSSTFVIKNFRQLCNQIDELYRNGRSNQEGKAATYIPELSRISSKNWGVAICTVDGQRYAVGNVNAPFTLQSCSKPLAYGLAVGEHGSAYVHEHVGMEPSGRNFDELCLDDANKPHNPMINAGAIMMSYLIKRDLTASDRFNYVYNQYKRLCGPEFLGFNNGIFLSEQESERCDGIYALAYFMKENKCFPQETNIQEIINFYLQICSLEITVESGAVIAATLANGGVNPLTGEAVLTNDAVRDTLTLMYSCGMNNYSGQFSFLVGLPAKSSVSGCILLVIPNTMGICLWSPPLDVYGNSSRGVQFCKDLVNVFNFHHFDNLRGHVNTKRDPRMAKAESRAHLLFDLLFSAAAGDLSSLRRHATSGTDMGTSDYDGRTPLHVASSEGHPDLVDFLLEECRVDPLPRDRWGRTPLDDSHVFGRQECTRVIVRYLEKIGVDPP